MQQRNKSHDETAATIWKQNRYKDRKAKWPEWQNSTETIGSVGLLSCPE